MSVPPDESVLRFRAMTFGVDRTYAVTVGFEMDRRPGHDSRGLLISRALPEDSEHDSSVYVEFGEPQQYCMEGGIERVESSPGIFRIEFTEAGVREMAGLRTIEILYEGAKGPEVLDALDYIFRGFDGYIRNASQVAGNRKHANATTYENPVELLLRLRGGWCANDALPTPEIALISVPRFTSLGPAWLSSYVQPSSAMFSFFRKKKLATERDFAVTGKVSVWIGDFDSEDALLDYLESADGCGEDFGCVMRDSRELSVKPEAKTVRELLRGFSWYEQFTDEIVAQAGANTRARCAVVSYASDYTLLGVTPKSRARLTFVGVASFGTQP